MFELRELFVYLASAWGLFGMRCLLELISRFKLSEVAISFLIDSGTAKNSIITDQRKRNFTPKYTHSIFH